MVDELTLSGLISLKRKVLRRGSVLTLKRGHFMSHFSGGQKVEPLQDAWHGQLRRCRRRS